MVIIMLLFRHKNTPVFSSLIPMCARVSVCAWLGWGADQWSGGGTGAGAEADAAHHGHAGLGLLALLDAV